MDDFLGTSIQYSEYQIKLLEREHYENQQKIVEDLINSGFLDSDYEEDTTTDNESSEASLEIKENEENESPLIQSVDDSDINISPKSLEDDSSTSIEEELSSPSSSTNEINENNDDLAMVLGSDISVVDESNVSNSESINDASINNQIINHSQQRQYRQYSVNHDNIDNDNECKVQGYEHENEYDSDDQIQEIQQFDIVTSKAIIRFMEIIFSDIKYLMILFILMIAMPHIIDRAHQNDNIYGGAGGVKYQSNGYQQHGGRGCHEAHFSTEIYWTLDRATTTQTIINEEDDERDEYQNDDEEDGDIETTKQCINKPHILKFDIISTKMDAETRKLRGHLSHHEFKIHASDLLSCHGIDGNKNINNMNFLRMRLKNMPIPREMGGLFMKIGAGFKGQQMMGKYTSIATHFTRSHGIYALVMAFVGIAGFAASNGIDEIITISS